jgi:hypothetical protein
MPSDSCHQIRVQADAPLCYKYNDMKTNMIFADRVARMGIAVAIAVLYFSKVIPTGLGLWMMIVAVVFLITGYTGFCPIYGIFGFKPKGQH